MSLFLPGLPVGQYPVGSTTFTSPVKPTVTFGSATYENGDPALVLDEIGYTAYYPANTTSQAKKGIDWLMRPLKESLKGFAIFGGVFWHLLIVKPYNVVNHHRNDSKMGPLACDILIRRLGQGTRLVSNSCLDCSS